jgi:putative membrane protein
MYQSNNRPTSLRWVLVPIGVLAVVAVLFIGVSLYFRGAPAQPYYGDWYWFPFGGLFFLVPVLFLGFFAFRFFWWGSCGWGSGRYPGWYQYPQDEAIETIRQRFARGEITKEQFEQLKKELEDGETAS